MKDGPHRLLKGFPIRIFIESLRQRAGALFLSLRSGELEVLRHATRMEQGAAADWRRTSQTTPGTACLRAVHQTSPGASQHWLKHAVALCALSGRSAHSTLSQISYGSQRIDRRPWTKHYTYKDYLALDNWCRKMKKGGESELRSKRMADVTARSWLWTRLDLTYGSVDENRAKATYPFSAYNTIFFTILILLGRTSFCHD